MTGPEPPTTSASQLERLRAGDRQAFDDLVRRYGPEMLVFAKRFMLREHDAEDALQDALLSAYVGISGFDGRSALSTWLRRITINACLMRMRSRRRRPECSIESLLPEFLPDGHQVSDTPVWEDAACRTGCGDAMAALVRSRLEEIPDDYRTVLLLRDVEQLSTEETAEAIGISKDAVKTRLHRARQALRGLLEPSFVARRTRS